MMIYEVRDYCTALLDPEGALISQNIGGVSHFVADLGVVVRDGVDALRDGGFAPGDVIMHNHQATAGQHLNNMVRLHAGLSTAGSLVAFAVVRAHWADVGGQSTGFGGTGAYDPWSEGLQIDQIKIYENGVPDEKILKLIRDNIRYPGRRDGRPALAARGLPTGRAALLRAAGALRTRHRCCGHRRPFTRRPRPSAGRRCTAIPDGVSTAAALLDGQRGNAAIRY